VQRLGKELWTKGEMQRFEEDLDNKAMENKYSLAGKKETYIF
jgi:hypothetical protein